MLKKIMIRWCQFLEEASEKSYREAIGKAVYKCLAASHIVVPVFNDLSKLKEVAKTDATPPLKFMLVDEVNAASLAPMYRTRSRRLKFASNMRAGYYAYAVASNGRIIGDIWCAAPGRVKNFPIHPDLSWLAIQCKESEAYMFDMYVAPDFRGKVITSFLLGGALSHLKAQGYGGVYGFYEKSNLPALWTHRLFGYTELGNRKITRFLFLQKSEPATLP